MAPEAIESSPAVVKEVMPEPELSVNKTSRSDMQVKEELPASEREQPVKADSCDSERPDRDAGNHCRN